MATLKIKVVEPSEPSESKVEDTPEDKDNTLQIKLKVRKTMDGHLVIRDHIDIDIVIDPENKTIITFPKNEMSDEAYQTQNNYFNFLAEKGVIDRTSVQGGNVFASIQAEYPDPIDEGISPTQLVLLSTYHFMEEERPRFEAEERYDDEIEDWYTEPTPEDSTALGEVPEKAEKGSISPNNPWTYYSGYYS